MKTFAIVLVTAGTGLTAAIHPLHGAETPAPAGKPAAIIITNKTESSGPARTPYLSAGLPEIVKMHKAGVDASVLLAFVQNSPTAYHPSAREIIYLRDQGLSSEIISAMLRRGGELRERAAEAAREERSRTAPPPTPAAPAAPETPAPPQAATPAPVVVYSNPVQAVYTTPAYVTYPAYRYAWPAYYNYSYYRPYYNYSYCRPYYRPSYSFHGSAYAGYGPGCYTGYPRYGLSVGFGGGHYYGHGGGYHHGGTAYCRR